MRRLQPSPAVEDTQQPGPADHVHDRRPESLERSDPIALALEESLERPYGEEAVMGQIQDALLAVVEPPDEKRETIEPDRDIGNRDDQATVEVDKLPNMPKQGFGLT